MESEFYTSINLDCTPSDVYNYLLKHPESLIDGNDITNNYAIMAVINDGINDIILNNSYYFIVEQIGITSLSALNDYIQINNEYSNSWVGWYLNISAMAAATYDFTTFYVGGNPYYIPHLTEAHKNVTWEQFINSPYNIGKEFYISGNYVFYRTGVIQQDYDMVEALDTILQGYNYERAHQGGAD